ncbi:MAG: hypothetical protein ACYDCP_00440 [Thermoplasmataceae archaeon]
MSFKKIEDLRRMKSPEKTLREHIMEFLSKQRGAAFSLGDISYNFGTPGFKTDLFSDQCRLRTVEGYDEIAHIFALFSDIGHELSVLMEENPKMRKKSVLENGIEVNYYWLEE